MKQDEIVNILMEAQLSTTSVEEANEKAAARLIILHNAILREVKFNEANDAIAITLNAGSWGKSIDMLIKKLQTFIPNRN